MSWVYKQASGVLYRPDGTIFGTGYAGHEDGVNNPAMESEHCIGPLPRGEYRMESIVDSDHTGRASIILVPDPQNQMFGRGGFRIHGDNEKGDRSASEGCIVIGHAADREAIFASDDHALIVEA